MQWTISDKLYGAWVKMRIRSECQTLPRRSANLWLDKVKSSVSKIESMFESSIHQTTSKWQYGVEMEGNLESVFVWIKSNTNCAKASGYWDISHALPSRAQRVKR